MRIVEVSYTVPPEVFIRRHVEALRTYTDLEVILVGRAPRGEANASASGVDGPVGPYERVMPNYDHLALPGKIWNLRHALAGGAWRARGPLRDKAVLGFFASLRPDLIHFHMAGLAVSMRWIPEALGIPYTVSLRGSDVQVEPLLNPRHRSKLASALARTAGIHCVSDEIRRSTESLLGQSLARARVIYTPIPGAADADCDGTGKRGRNFAIVTVGRLHWRKGLEHGVVAVGELRRRGVECQWLIVGDGPCRLQLEYAIRDEALEDAVTLMGAQPPGRVWQILRSGDAYFHPAVAEGLSNAMLEAMACGLPVVATRVGGADEAIVDGVHGFLTEPRDWRRMADALTILARDLELRRRIGIQARSLVLERFSPQEHARQFRSFFEEGLRNSPCT